MVCTCSSSSSCMLTIYLSRKLHIQQLLRHEQQLLQGSKHRNTLFLSAISLVIKCDGACVYSSTS